MDKNDLEKLFKKLCYERSKIENLLNACDEIAAIEKTLKYGICLRGISIVANLLEDNFDSFGVDIDARSIIEDLAIINAINNKLLNWEQYVLAFLHTIQTQ